MAKRRMVTLSLTLVQPGECDYCKPPSEWNLNFEENRKVCAYHIIVLESIIDRITKQVRELNVPS
jgi:hypothetical protein